MRDAMEAKRTAYFLACFCNGLQVYIGSTGVMINGRLMKRNSVGVLHLMQCDLGYDKGGIEFARSSS